MLSVARSSGRPGMVMGVPACCARPMKRATESGLTPRRASVDGSAVASEVSPCARQRPCTAPNTNSRFATIGPPMPPPS